MRTISTIDPTLRWPGPARFTAAGFVLFLAMFAQYPSAWAEESTTSAILPADIDSEHSAAYSNGNASPLEKSQLNNLLSSGGQGGKWSVVKSSDTDKNKPTAISTVFRLALKTPREIGSATLEFENAEGAAVTVGVLKSAADYPGDPQKPGDWETLEAAANHGRFECIFPRGCSARALLCTVTKAGTPPELRRWHFDQRRLHNITSYALVQGEQAPLGSAPGNIVNGGTWQNAGMNREKRVERHPITDVEPSWLILNWVTPQTPALVRIQGTLGVFKLLTFDGPPKENPALAGADRWKTLPFTQLDRRPASEGQESILLSVKADPTRTLKLEIEEPRPKGSQIVSVSEFSVWTDLKDLAVPPPPAHSDRPPVAIEYEVSQDSEMAMVIDDDKGYRVRNLFAQEERKAGKHVAYWDLTDEDGLMVPVGSYHWRAISAPPLQLRYEFTAYPNIEEHSPQSTPWPRGPRDGFLANHADLTAVCAVGDKVYMSAGGTEGGHALLEADLSGAKLWGQSDGASALFTDGKTLFIRWDDAITRFDAVRHERKPLFTISPTPERKGQLAGMAAQSGKIYAAFHGAPPYFENAAHTGLVDIDNCLPKLRPKIPRTDNRNIPLLPQRDFMSLFRLGGYIAADDRCMLSLETEGGVARRQYILLSFNRPVSVGSLIFPMPDPGDRQFSLCLLKPNATYPPRVKQDSDWVQIKTPDTGPWNCVAAPANTMTRAIRLTFAAPGDALADQLESGSRTNPDLKEDVGLGEHNAQDSGLLGAAEKWKGRIDGMRILQRRFEAASGVAVHVNSGTFDPKSGEWDAHRAAILSPDHPAIYEMEWNSPQKVRGLSVKEIDGAETEIDVYTGPEGKIDIESPMGWKKVATYKQELRNYYEPDVTNTARARYMDGIADFGDEYETRAIRLRVIKPWSEKSGYPAGVRLDRGGRIIDPKRCRIYGVTALRYLGGEPPTDPLFTQRLEIHDGETGKLEAEFPYAGDGEIAFGPDHRLYSIAANRVVRFDEAIKSATDFISTGLENPRLLAFSPDGRLLVYDHGKTERVVRVFDSAGKFQHLIGNPAPRVAGPYDPTNLGNVSSLSADRAGGVWMAYPQENPRRIMKFKLEGAFVREFLGNTNYGGGGVLDPYDRRRLYFKDMLFDLDWDRGTSRINAMMSLKSEEASIWSEGSFRVDMGPVVTRGHRYMVSMPPGTSPTQPVGAVLLYDEKSMTTRLAAAMGAAKSFTYLKGPEFLASLGGKPLGDFDFIWCDRNLDGVVQLSEVQFFPHEESRGPLGLFQGDLSVTAGQSRYEVKEFLSDGTPQYVCKAAGFSALYRLDNGNWFRFGKRPSDSENDANEVVNSAGERIWSYPAHLGMDGLFVPPWSPGVEQLQFGIVGHATAPGDLGEFLVINGNDGQTSIWTADGFLAGHITLHMLDPRATGWPAEHSRGTRLDGLTLGQEHFHAYFCKTDGDNHFYLVAGGNHISLIEVDGLENFHRIGGTIPVTPEIREKVRTWQAARVKTQIFARAPLINCPKVIPRSPGVIDEQSWGPPGSIGDIATFRMAHDERNLYLSWRGSGLFKNGGDDFHRYFKTGAAVDLMLGVDPGADVDRPVPGPGDLRLLVTFIAGAPKIVLYRPVASNAASNQAWQTTTPAGGTTHFDQVMLVQDAFVTSRIVEGGFRIDVMMPLAELGIKVTEGMQLKMDWGVLSTRDGNSTSSRQYWANSTAVGVADEPTEARLEPNLWGHVQFIDPLSGGGLGEPKKNRPTDDLEEK